MLRRRQALLCFVFVHTSLHSSSKVSHARIASLESQVETLAQSESRLKERVSTLEDEKQQLASTVTRLQDLLNSLGIHTTPDGLALHPASEKHSPPAPSAEILVTTDSVLNPLVHPEGS